MGSPGPSLQAGFVTASDCWLNVRLTGPLGLVWRQEPSAVKPSYPSCCRLQLGHQSDSSIYGLPSPDNHSATDRLHSPKEEALRTALRTAYVLYAATLTTTEGHLIVRSRMGKYALLWGITASPFASLSGCWAKLLNSLCRDAAPDANPNGPSG